MIDLQIESNKTNKSLVLCHLQTQNTRDHVDVVLTAIYLTNCNTNSSFVICKTQAMATVLEYPAESPTRDLMAARATAMTRALDPASPDRVFWQGI